MKIVIKEWLKSPKACLYLLTMFFTTLMYTIIYAQLLMVVSDAFSDPSNINQYLITVGIMAVSLMVLGAISEGSKNTAGNMAYTEFIERYANKILDADVQMFTKHSAAHIQSVSEFCGGMKSVMIHFVRFVLNMLSMVVTIFYMYKLIGNMIIIVILIYAVGAIGLKILFKRFIKIDEECAKSKRERSQEQENVVQGFTEVKSFNKIEYHRKRFHQFNMEAFHKYQTHTKLSIITSILFDLIDGIGLIAIMIYVAKRIILGLIDAAHGMTLVSYVFRLIGPLSMSLDFISDLSQDLAMADQYREIIEYVNQEKDNGKINLSEFSDSIKITDLDFSYGDSKNVLQGINMEIKKGSKVGICGLSGGGKSTIFKLLNRFYSPSKGSITIDGFDVQDITMSSYRKMIGSVHQENYIFPGTIKENIIYGTNSYTEEEFLAACKKANIYDFAMEQENKFDTVVGPRGLKLSGGQKQRIALARLLMMNPEIILLDEATSALDNESEYLIQDAIDNLGDKTIVSIAHRLSTIRNCDIIYVLGKNKILEQGNHESLMAMRGEYYQMNKIAERMEK